MMPSKITTQHGLFLMIILFLLPQIALAQTATEIIKKAEEKLQGNSSLAEMTIKIVRPKWEREMKMKAWSLGTKYSMTLITAPAKDRGTVMLKRDKEVWNWMPTIERTIKLPPSMMTQSWMGTDFTNDDLVNQSSTIEDYTHSIVKDSVVEGRNCWKIMLIPKPDAPVVWGKIYIWIDKIDYMQLRTEFYDEDNMMVSYMRAYDIKTLGGKILPASLEMVPVDKKGQKTIMTYNSLQFDIKIDEEYFTPQKMRQLKP